MNDNIKKIRELVEIIKSYEDLKNEFRYDSDLDKIISIFENMDETIDIINEAIEKQIKIRDRILLFKKNLEILHEC